MKKKLKKTIKKIHKSIFLCIFIFLILGVLIGFAGVSMLTNNDTFELIGNKNITLQLNEEYKELGVKVISFGKDLKNEVIIESNLDTSKEGEYTIIYSVNSKKYKNIKRVRYIKVVNGSDSDE